jgi:hypothetical protein
VSDFFPEGYNAAWDINNEQDVTEMTAVFKQAGQRRIAEEREAAALSLAAALWEGGGDEVEIGQQLRAVDPRLGHAFAQYIHREWGDYDVPEPEGIEDLEQLWQAEDQARAHQAAQEALAAQIQGFESVAQSFGERNRQLRVSPEAIGNQLSNNPDSASIITSGDAAQIERLLANSARQAQRIEDISAESIMESHFGRRNVDPTVQGEQRWNELSPQAIAMRKAQENFYPDGTVKGAESAAINLVGPEIPADSPLVFAEKPSGWTKGDKDVTKTEMQDAARSYEKSLKGDGGYWGNSTDGRRTWAAGDSDGYSTKLRRSETTGQAMNEALAQVCRGLRSDCRTLGAKRRAAVSGNDPHVAPLEARPLVSRKVRVASRSPGPGGSGQSFFACCASLGQ